MRIIKGKLNGIAAIFSLYKKDDIIINVNIKQKITLNKDGSINLGRKK